MFVIASDSFQGRGTGQPGIELAADYISDFYSTIGLKEKGDEGSYFQNFHLSAQVNKGIDISILTVSGTDTSTVYDGYFSNNSISAFYPEFGGDLISTGSLVFAGFGVTDPSKGVNHFSGVDLKDKWVMIFSEIPYIVGGDTLISTNISSRQRFNDILFRQGAAGLILISHFDETEFQNDALTISTLFGMPGGLSLDYIARRPSLRTSVLNISPSKAALLLGLEESDKSIADYFSTLSTDPSSFTARELEYLIKHTSNIENVKVPAKNVVGYIEGSDTALKDEYVILSAHYDHMGIDTPDQTGDRIYNGADDNGSGTVALLSIAKAMKAAKDAGYGPRRSVVFLHVTAEERGLLGSRYYSDYPTVPIENVIANLNIDMIGRIDEEHEAKDETDYVYIIGAEIISSDLNNTLNRANDINDNQIRFDMKYNDLQDRNQFYRRSDHWNFGRLGIPFIFYFTGVHADYHRPSDTPDKIFYDKYSKITRMIYSTAIELANDDEKPVVDSEEFIRITQANPR